VVFFILVFVSNLFLVCARWEGLYWLFAGKYGDSICSYVYTLCDGWDSAGGRVAVLQEVLAAQAPAHAPLPCVQQVRAAHGGELYNLNALDP
jgi:hypothetical protein